MDYQIQQWEYLKESIRLATSEEEKAKLHKVAKSHYFYVLQVYGVDLYEVCGGLEESEVK